MTVLTGLRWICERRTAAEARQDLKAWLGRWQGRYSRLCQWVEENIEETLSFYALPLAHHKHLKSADMLERLNGEIRRRTLVVRIVPNAASCLRLVRALAVEIHAGLDRGDTVAGHGPVARAGEEPAPAGGGGLSFAKLLRATPFAARANRQPRSMMAH